MCIYIYIYIYVYIHIHTFIHSFIHTYIPTYVPYIWCVVDARAGCVLFKVRNCEGTLSSHWQGVSRPSSVYQELKL